MDMAFLTFELLYHPTFSHTITKAEEYCMMHQLKDEKMTKGIIQ
jgi:hypothetical protein